MTASRACAVLLSLALVGGVAGCGDDEDGGDGTTAAPPADTAPTTREPATRGPAASDEVEIVDFKFAPAEIRVKKGTKLVWRNEDQAAHTATAEDRSFDTGAIAQGEQKSVTLTKAGRIAYICDFHPFMKGTVTVR